MNDTFSITIGRELGSGGKAIAKILADHFGCTFYDKQILTLAAKESGFSEKLFEEHDERHGRLPGILFNKVPIIGHANYYSEQVSAGSLFKFQSEVIWHEAKDHRCVFVGRCADYVLRKKADKVNIFIYANMDFKIRNVVEREGCSSDEARRKIIEGERKRSEFYNFYTGQKWGDKQYYDLCIDSSVLGIDKSATLLIQYINQLLELS